MFDSVEESFDFVALGVKGRVNRPLDFSVGFGQYDELRATRLNTVANGVAVVSLVSQQTDWGWRVRRHQVGIGRDVRSLALLQTLSGTARRLAAPQLGSRCPESQLRADELRSLCKHA